MWHVTECCLCVCPMRVCVRGGEAGTLSSGGGGAKQKRHLLYDLR